MVTNTAVISVSSTALFGRARAASAESRFDGSLPLKLRSSSNSHLNSSASDLLGYRDLSFRKREKSFLGFLAHVKYAVIDK